MIKKIISCILAVSISFGTLTAHAIMELPDEIIQTDYVKGKRTTTLNESDFIHINANEIRAKNLLNTSSIVDKDVFEEYDEGESNGKKQREVNGETEVPGNVTEVEGYVCLNEEDEEDITIIEDVVIEGEITPIERTSTYSARSVSTSVDNSYRMNRINSKDANALKNQTGKTNYIGDELGNEYIDPLTGNLVITETDLVLPGVDGLDLNLSRYYSLAESELYTKSVGVETNPEHDTFMLENGGFVVTETVTNTETNEMSTYNYFYLSQNQANKRVEEIESRDTKNGLYRYNADMVRKQPGEFVTVDYYYTSEITSTSYSRQRNNLGAGWSWCFPSVELFKENPDSVRADAIYYHDGKGNVMEVEYSRADGYSFVNYLGEDITFEENGDLDDSIDYDLEFYYVVNDSDGTNYYFGKKGELTKIVDRYGNEITFSYVEKDFYGAEDSLLISEIRDTVGRTITFSYSDRRNGFEYITITVTSPIPSEGTLSLSYEKRMIDVERADGTFVSSEPILEEVTNPIGEVTAYYPAMKYGVRNNAYPIKFTFADKSFNSDFVYNTSGYANNLVYLLGNVVRKHSNTYYDYDLCERNLGHSGVSEAYRVSERGDFELVIDSEYAIIEGNDKNVIEYDYSRDYTGYPFYNSIESMPDDDAQRRYIARTKITKDNVYISRDFYKIDNAALMKKEISRYSNLVGKDLTVTTENTSFLHKFPYATTITYSNGDYSYESYIQREFHLYNDKGYGKPTFVSQEIPEDLVNTQAEDKYGTSYEYDGNTGFMINKSWYQNDSTQCIEYYRYNDKQRLSSIQKANGSTEQYTYTYNADGKITKRKITTENDLGKTTIEENYTAATGYAFPSTIVKKITKGAVTTTETTSYTYNMLLGVVTSETDSEGNVTYYEYDAIARPTKIIYPIYDTFTSYNIIGQSIMPVEEFEYNTVIRADHSMLSNDEFLLAQEIYSSLTNYDVTNVSTTSPLQIDLTNLPYTFYSGEVNYYMGTGEIFESNVAELVEGDGACVTTKYKYDVYYDAANNKFADRVQEIDAQGNVTSAYYDGLGRVVKTIDKFNNYHITEYNLAGNGAGFKSQSYFVPSSDRNKKENIIEYDYDRMQRVISERAFSEYPNDYVETQYSYDIIGNVTGVIDSNGNLNEDGYTESYGYDKLDRVTSIKNANNEIITNTYDKLGNVKIQKINGSNLYRRYYDGAGRLAVDSDNSENSNEYTYDSQGRLSFVKDKNGVLSQYVYNQCGFVADIQHAKNYSGLINRRYAYTNPYSSSTIYDLYFELGSDNDITNGYLTAIQNNEIMPSGKVFSKYFSHSYYTGVDGMTFSGMSQYLYDELGNLSSTLHGSVNSTGTIFGDHTYYTYDRDRPSKVQIDGANARNTADSSNVKYEFYDDGKLKSISYPPFSDGTVLKSEYTYDGLSRLQTLTNYKGTVVLSNYIYTYDANGNITKTVENVSGVSNETDYTYDKLNRISTVSGTKGTDSYYEYDERGNRKANYEQIDFLSEENFEYLYTEENNLYYVGTSDAAVNFDYNADGYRYVKDKSSELCPIFYIYDEAGRLVSEVCAMIGDNQYLMHPIRHYIWGPDRVLAQRDVYGNCYYYLYNGHGDVVQIVDTNGNVVNSYDYDVWGNFLKKEETIENSITYFGQTYDEETGLYYLRARYYDPSTGRFTQQDTAEDGYNWYVYGNQNPITYIDESGESITLSAGAAALLYEAAPYIAAGLALAGTVTINYFKSHSKNARKSNWDKHTKKRAGAPSKAEKKPGWQDRSNKKKP